MELKRSFLRIYLILQILGLVFWFTFGLLVYILGMAFFCPIKEELLQNPELMRDYLLHVATLLTFIYLSVSFSSVYSARATKKLLSNKTIGLLDKISLFSGVISNGFILFFLVYQFL